MTKLNRMQELTVLYQVCLFQADRKNKMVALVSDWLRHYRLLPCNHWTECNETSQNIVAAFWGRHVSPAKHSYPWLPRKCDYWTYIRTDRYRTKWSLRADMLRMRHKKQDLNVLYQVCVLGPIIPTFFWPKGDICNPLPPLLLNPPVCLHVVIYRSPFYFLRQCMDYDLLYITSIEPYIQVV